MACQTDPFSQTPSLLLQGVCCAFLLLLLPSLAPDTSHRGPHSSPFPCFPQLNYTTTPVSTFEPGDQSRKGGFQQSQLASRALCCSGVAKHRRLVPSWGLHSTKHTRKAASRGLCPCCRAAAPMGAAAGMGGWIDTGLGGS